jgi:hypothetical protein
MVFDSYYLHIIVVQLFEYGKFYIIQQTTTSFESFQFADFMRGLEIGN